MKSKLLIVLILLLLIVIPFAVKAEEVCREYYFIMERTKIVKINVNYPDKAYQIYTFDSQTGPQTTQPYLFRLNNGEHAIVFKSSSTAEQNDRKIFFKNLVTGLETVVQSPINRSDVEWNVTYPRATQLINGDIYVVFSTHDPISWEQCKWVKDCFFDARIRVMKSVNNGHTWQFAAELKNELTNTPDRGGLWQPMLIEMNNHDLGMILTEQSKAPPPGQGCNYNRLDSVSFYVSHDQGINWERRSNIYTGNCTVNNEGYIFQQPSGRLVALFAGHEPPSPTSNGAIKRSFSYNEGVTWSQPEKIADTVEFFTTHLPIIEKVGYKNILSYFKIPNGREGGRQLTIKIADNLNPEVWNSMPDYYPTIVGAGTIGPNCDTFSPVLVPPSYVPGDLIDSEDITLDNVNIFDYNFLLSKFGQNGPDGWIKADINEDGKVNREDYDILTSNFNK